MPTPNSIRNSANHVGSTKTESISIKNSFLKVISDAQCYWSSDSATLFYDECEEILLQFNQMHTQLDVIREKINALSNEVQRADQERAAKLEAERRAAEAALVASKKNTVVK